MLLLQLLTFISVITPVRTVLCLVMCISEHPQIGKEAGQGRGQNLEWKLCHKSNLSCPLGSILPHNEMKYSLSKSKVLG